MNALTGCMNALIGCMKALSACTKALSACTKALSACMNTLRPGGQRRRDSYGSAAMARSSAVMLSHVTHIYNYVEHYGMWPRRSDSIQKNCASCTTRLARSRSPINMSILIKLHCKNTTITSPVFLKLSQTTPVI